MRALPQIVLLMVSGAVLTAGPITYTFTGSISGTLGSTPFSDAAFTWSVIADTSTVTTPNHPTQFVNIGTSSSIDIAGVGDAIFTEPIAVVADQRSNHGDVTVGDTTLSIEGIGIVDPTDIDAWADPLATSIGPIAGTPEFISSGPLTTTLGNLTITGVDLTFQASTVPEPATGGFALAALAGLALAKRSRQIGRIRRF